MTDAPRSDADDRSLTAVLGERRALLNLAFRMLGSSYDAEDVVQETYTRWYALSEEDRRGIRTPMAWLVRVASRICLDQLSSARVRRESYLGEWLPEPLPGAPWDTGRPADPGTDPAEQVSLDESVTMGVLVVLDSVTPAERVVFILHDVFGVPFTEIAETVGRSPAACRQLASTARRRVRASQPRSVRGSRHRDVVSAFKRACETGDLEMLVGLLAAKMRLLADTLNDVFGATDDDVQVEGLAMSGTAGRTLVQIARRDDDLPGRGGRASKGAASKALPGRPVLSHPRLVPGARRAAVAPPARPGSDDQPETASEGHGRRPRRGTAPGRSTRARVHRR
ncbi:sigma-70 family RNA polymerase sigma factor [Streptomyces sp. MI02-2A]|uniref:sigma-70 family RNA polymerase sigma factor n=1 Tax=Streptomyces sp. MI02-2A TaxID=3028688 RepID=UPI0029B7617B|nr:sigma-70 family RNA polymerase sigma factor [Streptomyces sp. MI02-2A]MDX3259629.1 sigma-70 family RNA polymerase sigma factor [Streptomyces sp. MI02-2A]